MGRATDVRALQPRRYIYGSIMDGQQWTSGRGLRGQHTVTRLTAIRSLGAHVSLWVEARESANGRMEGWRGEARGRGRTHLLRHPDKMHVYRRHASCDGAVAFVSWEPRCPDQHAPDRQSSKQRWESRRASNWNNAAALCSLVRRSPGVAALCFADPAVAVGSRPRSSCGGRDGLRGYFMSDLSRWAIQTTQQSVPGRGLHGPESVGPDDNHVPGADGDR